MTNIIRKLLSTVRKVNCNIHNVLRIFFQQLVLPQKCWYTNLRIYRVVNCWCRTKCMWISLPSTVFQSSKMYRRHWCAIPQTGANRGTSPNDHIYGYSWTLCTILMFYKLYGICWNQPYTFIFASLANALTYRVCANSNFSDVSWRPEVTEIDNKMSTLYVIDDWMMVRILFLL